MFEEIFKRIVEESGEPEDKIKTEIDKAKQEAIEVFGIPETDALGQAHNMVYASYAKRKLGMAEIYKGLIFEFGHPSDYGATQVFEDIKTKFENADNSIKKAMYDEGIIDEEGNPLWYPGNTNAKFKYFDTQGNKMKDREDRKINPEREWSTLGLALLKKESDNDYKPSLVTVYGRGENTIATKKIVEIKLIGKYDETWKIYRLSTAIDKIDCKVVEEKEMKYADYSELIDKYFDNFIIDISISDPKDWLVENDKIPLAIVKGGIVTRVVDVMDSSKSNVINLGSIILGMSGDDQLSCFVPNHIPLPIEGLGEVIVAGTFGKDMKTVNVLDLVMKFKPKKAKEINPEEGTLKVVTSKKKEKPDWLK